MPWSSILLLLPIFNNHESSKQLNIWKKENLLLKTQGRLLKISISFQMAISVMRTWLRNWCYMQNRTHRSQHMKVLAGETVYRSIAQDCIYIGKLPEFNLFHHKNTLKHAKKTLINMEHLFILFYWLIQFIQPIQSTRDGPFGLLSALGILGNKNCTSIFNHIIFFLSEAFEKSTLTFTIIKENYRILFNSLIRFIKGKGQVIEFQQILINYFQFRTNVSQYRICWWW